MINIGSCEDLIPPVRIHHAEAERTSWDCTVKKFRLFTPWIIYAVKVGSIISKMLLMDSLIPTVVSLG